MKLSIVRGATSVIVHLFIQDSASATGGGKTGLVYNSTSLTAYYIRPGDASATAISLVTATVGTWTSGGFKEVDATNMPGVYEFGIPNALLNATGTKRQVTIFFKGASGMAPLPIEIALTGIDNQDGVRGGMTALPNAAAEAAGGLPTAGTGTNQIDLSGGLVGLTAVANAAIADKFLGRNIAGGSDGGRTVKDAFRTLRNRTAISSGTLTVYAEDDTTPAWTGAVTMTPGDPISQIDPS